MLRDQLHLLRRQIKFHHLWVIVSIGQPLGERLIAHPLAIGDGGKCRRVGIGRCAGIFNRMASPARRLRERQRRILLPAFCSGLEVSAKASPPVGAEVWQAASESAVRPRATKDVCLTMPPIQHGKSADALTQIKSPDANSELQPAPYFASRSTSRQPISRRQKPLSKSSASTAP